MNKLLLNFLLVSAIHAQTIVSLAPDSPAVGAILQTDQQRDILDVQVSGTPSGLLVQTSGPVGAVVIEDSFTGVLSSPVNWPQPNQWLFNLNYTGSHEIRVRVTPAANSVGQWVSAAVTGVGVGQGGTVAGLPVQGNPQAIVQAVVPRNSVANYSTSANINQANPAFTLGFVVAGDAQSFQSVLVRAVGPSLSTFGVTNASPSTSYVVHGPQGATYSVSGVSATAATAAQSAGAFPLTAQDSAKVFSLLPGAYTVQVTGQPGAVLCEVYILQ